MTKQKVKTWSKQHELGILFICDSAAVHSFSFDNQIVVGINTRMPVKKCSNGKYRIGSGDCVYTSREKAERAQKAYHAQKEARQIIESVLMEAQLNKKSDWNAEQAVTRIQKSPLYRSTKGYQDPEEIRKTVLQNREKFEKKIYDKIFLPVNDSVVNLEQMFRESGSTVATYLSDNEKKLLQQFLEDLKELHDRFENSGIFSKDYL